MISIKSLATLIVSSLLLSPLAILSVGENEDFTLSGRVTYVTRMSKSVTTQAKYSFTVTNNLHEDLYKDVYLFLWQTNPDNITVYSPDASVFHLDNVGEYCLLGVKVASKVGSQSFDLSFNPSEAPINVHQEIYVNDVAKEPSFEGESCFLTVEKGDTVTWNLRIENELEAVLLNGSRVRPALPIVVNFYLDEKYLKKLEVSPETNKTIFSEPNSLSWHLILRDSVDIYVKAQVYELTEWGIIPTRSLSVEFNSGQYDYYIAALSSQRSALVAMLEAFRTILNGSDLISSGLYNISDVLEAIGAGVSGGGSATAYVGSALTATSGQIQPMVSTLREYSSLLKLIKNFSSSVDLAEVYAQVNKSLPAIYSSLASSYNVVSEDLSRLLYVNNTLNQLLQATEDDTQRSALVSATQAITAIYNNNLRLKDTIVALMRSIESLELAMSGVSVEQIRQLQRLLAKLPDVSENFSKLAEQLKVAGDALIEIGKSGKEIGKALCELAAHIRDMTNMSLGASSPLMDYYSKLSSSLSQIDKDLSLLHMSKSIFLFGAPREKISQAGFYISEPRAYDEISLDTYNITFVNYLTIPKSSLKNIRILDEAGFEVNNLSDIGSWEYADLIYIPVMQKVEGNVLRFISWEVIPFTLNVSSPLEIVLMASEPIDAKNFEFYCSVNLEQPMLVSKMGLIFLPPESKVTTLSRAWDLEAFYASVLLLLALALTYLLFHKRKRVIYKRRKTILEKYEAILKEDERIQSNGA